MKWVVIGAGRSGIGAKELLEHHKHKVFLFDENPSKVPSDLQKSLIHDSEHSVFFEKETTIVVSPGVPWDHPMLQRARKAKQKVISEIDLALSYYKGELIAVTGTNGKSTTVMMIAHILKALNYDFDMGGNIGIAASSLMLKAPRKYLLLELSSYQIEASELLRPRVAVLTGIAPDHMSRHKTLKGYIEAKWKLFEKQGHTDLAIIEEDVYKQAIDECKLPKPKSKILIISKKNLNEAKDHLSFRWKHDLLNATFALHAVSFISKKPTSELASLLTSYRGLPFRCELIGKLGSWSIVNDSKGTNMDSTVHALDNIHGKITLFLGGYGKGESFKDILKFSHNIKEVIAFGKSGPQVFQELNTQLPTKLYPTLAKAMDNIHTILVQAEGDIIFSPACASQDEFTDFEERGKFFTQHVHSSLKRIEGGLIIEPILGFEKN